jgi:hypothetical protein
MPMEQINPMDSVQVVQAKPGEESFLNKVGQVVMIVDGDQYFVAFEDGSSAAFGADQLRRAG